MQSPGSERLFAAWKFTAEIGKLGQKMLKGLQFHENEALVLYTNFFYSEFFVSFFKADDY